MTDEQPTTSVEKQAATMEAGAKNLRRKARLDKTPPPASNLRKATVVGVSTGGTGAVVISWLATEAERRYAVPQAVTAGILGAAFGFVARWAAKLLPDD